MKYILPRNLIILAFFSVSCLWAQTDVFSHFSTALHAGVLSPQYELKDILGPRPLFGLRFNSPYKNNWLVHAQLQYAYLDGDNSPRSLHYIKSGLGLGFSFPVYSSPVLGLGFSNHFIRAVVKRNSQKFLLDDNESEFGFYPFIHACLPITSSLDLTAGLGWEIIFSEPKYSHLPNLTAGLQYNWW